MFRWHLLSQVQYGFSFKYFLIGIISFIARGNYFCNFFFYRIFSVYSLSKTAAEIFSSLEDVCKENWKDT